MRKEEERNTLPERESSERKKLGRRSKKGSQQMGVIGDTREVMRERKGKKRWREAKSTHILVQKNNL